MNAATVVVEGRVQPDGTPRVTEKVDLPAGRVHLTIQPVAETVDPILDNDGVNLGRSGRSWRAPRDTGGNRRRDRGDAHRIRRGNAGRRTAPGGAIPHAPGSSMALAESADRAHARGWWTFVPFEPRTRAGGHTRYALTDMDAVGDRRPYGRSASRRTASCRMATTESESVISPVASIAQASSHEIRLTWSSSEPSGSASPCVRSVARKT